MAIISVIVPVYKVEQFLRRCVDSILGQSFSNFELILVDDGSPDRCGEICDEYTAADRRVHVIHQQNGGLSAARNAGILWAMEHSNSEWLTFVDSDDYIHPRFLEALYSAIEHTGQKLAVCMYKRVASDSSVDNSAVDCAAVNETTESFYCREKIIATIACAKLYLKSDFQEIRFPEGETHEDELTTYKLLFRYDQIAVVDTALYFYCINTQSITKSAWTPKRLSEVTGEKQQLEFFLEHGYMNAASRAARAYLSGLGRNLIHAKRAGNDKKEYVSSLKKQLRNGLKRYKKLSKVNLKEDSWLFYLASPVTSFPYRVISFPKTAFTRLACYNQNRRNRG